MGEEASRYDAVAVALHWLIGVALLAQITFGFLLDEIAPRGTPSRSAVINLHKSFGLVLAVAILARLAWRLGHRAPPWPATMPSGSSAPRRGRMARPMPACCSCRRRATSRPTSASTA